MKKLILFVLVILMFTTSVFAECVDSDDGKDFDVKGTTIYTKNGNEISNVEDACLDENRLEEFFCDPDGKTTSERYDCVEGCEEGACKGKIETIEVPKEEFVETPQELENEDGVMEITPEETIVEDEVITPKKTNYLWIGIFAILVILAIAIFVFKKRSKKEEHSNDYIST